jgi:hypothetical protein
MREMATKIVDVTEQKRLNEAREQKIPWNLKNKTMKPTRTENFRSHKTVVHL